MLAREKVETENVSVVQSVSSPRGVRTHHAVHQRGSSRSENVDSTRDTAIKRVRDMVCCGQIKALPVQMNSQTEPRNKKSQKCAHAQTNDCMPTVLQLELWKYAMLCHCFYSLFMGFPSKTYFCSWWNIVLLCLAVNIHFYYRNPQM